MVPGMRMLLVSLEDLPADKKYGYPAKPLQKEKEEGGKAHPFDICLQLSVHPVSPAIPRRTEASAER